MAVKLYNDTDIQNIADSIRAKNGSGYTYKVSEMSAAINGLEVLNGETVSITPSTSAQTITPSSGHNGITEVNVAAVTSSIDSNIQAGNIKKDVSILGVTGTLNEGITPTGELAITSNGTYNVTDYASANVNVPEKQLGTKTITSNGTYKATDDNLDGYSKVTVETSGVDINDYFRDTLTAGTYNYPGYITAIKKIKSPLVISGSNASYMFAYSKLDEIPVINTSSVTNMSQMFYNSKTTTLDLSSFDTSKVTNMASMFDSSAATTLDLSSFNTSNVTNMRRMFYNSKATTLDLSGFDTSKVNDMYGMFDGCKVTTLDLSNFNTSNVNDMEYMFNNSKITTLDLSNFDTSKIKYISDIFSSCWDLTNITGCLQNLGQAYDTSKNANYSYYTLSLSNSNSLTRDSLMNIINGLYDIATKGVKTQSLVLGSTNLAKLTAEEIAIATNKGWSVS